MSKTMGAWNPSVRTNRLGTMRIGVTKWARGLKPPRLRFMCGHAPVANFTAWATPLTVTVASEPASPESPSPVAFM